MQKIHDPWFPGSNNTRANGINDSGTIVGDLQNSGNIYHGFIYSRLRYTQYDVPGSANTSILAINNAGNLAGSAAVVGGGGNKGFVVIRGTATEFYVNGSIQQGFLASPKGFPKYSSLEVSGRKAPPSTPSTTTKRWPACTPMAGAQPMGCSRRKA